MPHVNGTVRNGTGRVHPIVGVLREQGRTQTWLARRIGRTHEYVNRTLNGRHPAVPAFRAACALALGMGEDELFDQGDASATPHAGANHRGGIAGVAAPYADPTPLSTPQEAPHSRTA